MWLFEPMKRRDLATALLPEPRIERGAGGLHSAVLADDTVSYDQFPQLAEFIANAIEARIIERTDVFDTRLWKIALNTPPPGIVAAPATGLVAWLTGPRPIEYRLVWQDFPCEVSLESIDRKGDAVLDLVIALLAARLRAQAEELVAMSASRPDLPGTDLLRAVLPDARLSVFTLVRELHFRIGNKGAEVLLRLSTEKHSPPVELVMIFRGVVDFCVKGLGGLLPQVMGFEVESIRDQQWDQISWRVSDYEDARISFLACDAAIIECGPPQAP